jgi:allophanate hydrolase subunit 2
MKVAEVIDPGMLCTIQDLGRKGYYSIGIPNSGAFDQISFKYGNAILKNNPNDAGIEVLWGGLRLAFLEETIIAITGADMYPKVDDAVVPMWQPIEVKKGQILTLRGPPQTGVRAYLTFAGGIDVPEFYGSRSTYLLLGRGGYEGRKLGKKDILSSFETVN